MHHLIRPGTNYDIVGKRNLWMGLSLIAILLTFVLLFTKGLNYGIDFTGGAEVAIKAPQGWDISKVRTEMDSSGIKNPKVVQIGSAAENSYLVKAQGDEHSLNQVASQVQAQLAKDSQPGQYEILRSDVVGPAAGGSLRMSGFLSMLYALLLILIYVAIRFDVRYAPGAVLALFHDTCITVGVFILTQKQFDLQILAAILALIGYSNNDTIIVYDRVRETTQANPSMSIEAAVNKAINETLSRTILTSLCTFLTVFALWVAGGKVIQDFAFTLMIGIIVGSYSSIFIASSLVIFMTHWQAKRTPRRLPTSGAGQKRVSQPTSSRPEPGRA